MILFYIIIQNQDLIGEKVIRLSLIKEEDRDQFLKKKKIIKAI